jgi:HK97 family phage major capsid protein
MTVFTQQHRAKLQDARDRKRKALERMNAAKQAINIANQHSDPTAAGHAEIALEMARGEQSMAIELESALLHQIAGVESYTGESCLDNPDTIRALETMAHTSQPIGNVMLGQFMDAEQLAASLGRSSMYAANGGPGPVTVPPDVRMERPYGIVRQLYRPVQLLDLIPTATMEGLSFVYVRESGSLDSGAAETVELALKPEETGLDMSEEGTVTAVTVAVWKKVSRQSLDDLAGLATMLQQRLTYLVRRRVEQQVVQGDGQAGNIQGVLNTTGIGSVPFATGTPASDLILQGLTNVRLANAEPDAVLLNPTTYAGMLSEKATGSGERLDSSGAFDSPADSVWGVPVIQSAVVDPTKAVCADWGRSCTVYVREGLNLRTSDSDQDDFVRNRVTILAETRVGLAIWQPTGICEVALA